MQHHKYLYTIGKSFTSQELRMQCGSGELQEIIRLKKCSEKKSLQICIWQPWVTTHHSFNTHSVVRPGAHSITLGEGFSAGESVCEK